MPTLLANFNEREIVSMKKFIRPASMALLLAFTAGCASWYDSWYDEGTPRYTVAFLTQEARSEKYQLGMIATEPARYALTASSKLTKEAEPTPIFESKLASELEATHFFSTSMLQGGDAKYEELVDNPEALKRVVQSSVANDDGYLVFRITGCSLEKEAVKVADSMSTEVKDEKAVRTGSRVEDHYRLTVTGTAVLLQKTGEKLVFIPFSQYARVIRNQGVELQAGELDALLDEALNKCVVEAARLLRLHFCIGEVIATRGEGRYVHVAVGSKDAVKVGESVSFHTRNESDSVAATAVGKVVAIPNDAECVVEVADFEQSGMRRK